MSKVITIDHPLAKHKLTQLRKKETDQAVFNALVSELACMLAIEVTKDLDLAMETIETPLEETEQPVLPGNPLVIIPILRAGIGMVDGFRYFLPNAKIGHLGLFRDPETKIPVEYFKKFPKEISSSRSVILDPMLATGGSAIAAIDELKKETDQPITLAVILAAPEGIKAVQEAHPDVDIYCVDIDRELDENKYIRPGLGDAGDRLFGTL